MGDAAGLAGALPVGTGLAQAQTATGDRGEALEVPANPQRVAAISFPGVDVALAPGIMPVAPTYLFRGESRISCWA